MEVILKVDIKGVGYKNDLVSVKNGFGRNYLIPQGFAVLGTASAKKQLEENVRQASHKAAKLVADAEVVAEKIKGIALELKAKVGDTGKIFGAVTPLQISEALKGKGVDVDRKKISIKGDVKQLGNYIAEIDLHKSVRCQLNFEVISE